MTALPLAVKEAPTRMSKRALVCEDDGAIRLLLDRLLTRQGLSTECVATGTEAAAKLRRASYDLILLDLVTPKMSGFDVIAHLERERPHLLERVIVVTAVQPVFAKSLPVAAFLRKPFDLEELDQTIRQLLPAGSIDDNRLYEQNRPEGDLR
jgi:CheY-like chemotaxis protein